MKDTIVQVTGFTAPFRGSPAEMFLSEEDAAVLHERWNDSAWSERLDCGGGEYSISCEQILEVPLQDFARVYGKTLSSRILSAVRGGI
jgi:hypothetical protein